MQKTVQKTVEKTRVKTTVKSSEKGSEKTTVKGSEKATQKTTQKTIELIKTNPHIGRKEMANMIGNISENGVKYHLAKLKEQGKLKRVEPDKGGYWEINKLNK